MRIRGIYGYKKKKINIKRWSSITQEISLDRGNVMKIDMKIDMKKVRIYLIKVGTCE